MLHELGITLPYLYRTLLKKHSKPNKVPPPLLAQVCRVRLCEKAICAKTTLLAEVTLL